MPPHRSARAKGSATAGTLRSPYAGIVDVGAVALAACVAGIANQLAHDDLHLVQNNPRAQDVTDVAAIFASPFWPPPFSPDLYRPLTTFLMAVQQTIGQGEPIVFRLVSYILYAVVSIAVLLLARRFVSYHAALAAAALFAAHPVHVEAVALAVGQGELAVALIAVIATTQYVKWRRAGPLHWRHWIWLALLYAAAALFKENGLVIPGLLLAAEALLLRDSRASWRSLAPGYATLAAVAAAMLALRTAVLGEARGTFVAEALDGIGTGDRLLTVLRVVPEWARLLTWPAHLRLDYSPQEFVASTGFGAIEALGAFLLVALMVTGWACRQKAPLVTFGLLWLGIAILPVSNLIVPTGVLIAERTLFVPSVGVALAFAGGVNALAPRFTAPALAKTAAAVAMILVMAGVVRSAERQRVWRHDGFLAVRTASDAPRSFRAQRAYADVLFAIGQPDAANRAYARALELVPAALQWRVRNDYARQLRLRQDHPAEIEQLRASLAQRHDQGDTRGYLVVALLAAGRYPDARQQADSAMALGEPASVFAKLAAIADSARQAGAPPGSVRVGLSMNAPSAAR